MKCLVAIKVVEGSTPSASQPPDHFHPTTPLFIVIAEAWSRFNTKYSRQKAAVWLFIGMLALFLHQGFRNEPIRFSQNVLRILVAYIYSTVAKCLSSLNPTITHWDYGTKSTSLSDSPSSTRPMFLIQ